MSDSSDIDAALLALLGSDTPLLALMTNGVYWEEASIGMTKFVVVSLVEASDTGMFGGRAFEQPIYLVKAVAKGSSGADVKAAAARIDALLEFGTLTVTGYKVSSIRRDSRIRFTEVDELDTSIRWQHRGGRYVVTASPGV